MKKITLIVCSLLTITLFACKKTDVAPNKTEDLYKNSPSSLVPDNLSSGVWFYGTLSAISYWDRDGHHLGNDYEAGREYQFSNVGGQGRLKFHQYLGTRTSSSCVAEYFTYKEGTVKFDGDKFTFYPVKGNFKTIKKDCSSSNGTTERKAGADDLKPDTYRWELATIEGERYFNVYTEDDLAHEDVIFSYSYAP